MNIAIILAAGDSQKFSGSIHKQYLKLNGKEVFWYSYKELLLCKNIDKIILVLDKTEFETGYIKAKYNIETIQGGNTRNESISNAISYVKNRYSCEKILFHDSVRPFFSCQKFSQYIDKLNDFDAVVTAADITDTLVTESFDYCDRTKFSLIQAPEAFRFDIISSYFDEKSPYGAIVNHLPKTSKILKITENVFNFKISYPQDLFLAEQFARISFFTTKYTGALIDFSAINNVLLLGGSGGIGSAVKQVLKNNNISFFAPSHKDLDLAHISAQSVLEYCKNFIPNVIINAAAAYEDDSCKLTDSFDKIFAVNLKSNLALIEFAKLLKRRVNIVVLSSSSSTKGRENLTNYSAAKAALNSIVESQANTLSKQNIYLNAVVPEKVNTALIEKLHKTTIANRELLDVEEVLNAIFYCANCTHAGKLYHVRKGL